MQESLSSHIGKTLSSGVSVVVVVVVVVVDVDVDVVIPVDSGDIGSGLSVLIGIEGFNLVVGGFIVGGSAGVDRTGQPPQHGSTVVVVWSQ